MAYEWILLHMVFSKVDLLLHNWFPHFIISSSTDDFFQNEKLLLSFTDVYMILDYFVMANFKTSIPFRLITDVTKLYRKHYLK